MEERKPSYEDFLLDVHPHQRPFVEQTHAYLLQNGCKVKVETAKNGYVVSYTHTATKRVIVNYVFRKKGVYMRIYGDNVAAYESLLNTLPDEMKSAIEKATACKRLLDPTKCNARCPMGYAFTMDGVVHKKCRYGSFMFLLDAESNPYLSTFIENEIKERAN